ncbi:hypothetical protein FB451DRAFT_1171763 [Mycena latifolia]|nr:hypothetical protein FB451DRAFT_1171763 [Mycena latifolia]
MREASQGHGTGWHGEGTDEASACSMIQLFGFGTKSLKWSTDSGQQSAKVVSYMTQHVDGNYDTRPNSPHVSTVTPVVGFLRLSRDASDVDRANVNRSEQKKRSDELQLPFSKVNLTIVRKERIIGPYHRGAASSTSRNNFHRTVVGEFSSLSELSFSSRTVEDFAVRYGRADKVEAPKGAGRAIEEACDRALAPNPAGADNGEGDEAGEGHVGKEQCRIIGVRHLVALEHQAFERVDKDALWGLLRR